MGWLMGEPSVATPGLPSACGRRRAPARGAPEGRSLAGRSWTARPPCRPSAGRRRRRPPCRRSMPEVTATRSPSVSPSVTVLAETLLSADHVDEGALLAPLDRRGRDHGRASVDVEEHPRPFTNWFGKRASSSFGNVARSLKVPVVGSTVLSIVERLPVASFLRRVVGRRRRPGSVPADPLLHRRDVVLGEREDDGDRLHLGQDDEPRGVARRHVVALVHEPGPRALGPGR
jgi:hypothetical protein